MNGAPGEQPKKGLSPLAWVGIGCGSLIVLGLVAMTVGGIFVAKKAADFAEDVSENPAAAAEMLIGLNPDLEVVESDRDAGTITIREKSTGKTMTVNYDQISEGKITFEDESGETGSINLDQGEDGTLSVTTDEGTASFGASGAAVELPDWLPRYSGSVREQGGFTSATGGKRNGIYSFKTDDSPEDVLAFYEGVLKDLGLEVTESSMSSGGESVQMRSGKSSEYTISATVTTAGEGVSVAVTYQGPE